MVRVVDKSNGFMFLNHRIYLYKYGKKLTLFQRYIEVKHFIFRKSSVQNRVTS